MSRTYVPIASTTLTSSTASVVFGSGGTLPQTYTDLVLACRIKPVDTNNPSLVLRINGDTSTNYHSNELWGNGTTTSHNGLFTQNTMAVSRMLGLSSTVTTPTVLLLYLNSYSRTNMLKTILARTGSPGLGVGMSACLWNSTNAITSFQLYVNTNSFDTGSQFSLYGIKAK